MQVETSSDEQSQELKKARAIPDPAGIKTNDKKDDEFRVYKADESLKRVVDHYRDMRTNQTVDFYKVRKLRLIFLHVCVRFNISQY